MTEAEMTPAPDGVGVETQPAPTQTRHPWRATLRTIFALLVALASLAPEALAAAHVDSTAIGAQVLVVAATVTRVLALPSVEAFLARFAPWLAAAPGAVPAAGKIGA